MGKTSRRRSEAERPPLLAELTSPKVRTLIDAGPVDVLLPLGSLEQHGPHLPLATDTVIAEAIALEVGRRVGDLVIAPCMQVGYSDHHLSFAGTASLPVEIVAGYIGAVAVTLLGHGFRFVYVVTGHAGNIPAMKAAVASLPADTRDRVAPFTDWPAQREAMHDWASKALGLSGQEVGSHAGHFETSIMLELAGSSVDMPSAPRGFVGPVDEASALMEEAGIKAVSEVGVVGDARSATAEAGVGYLKVLAEPVAAFVEQHRAVREQG